MHLSPPQPRGSSERGSVLSAALFMLVIAGGLIYVAAITLNAMDLRMRRKALVDESVVILNAIRVHQSDNAAALSTFNTVVDVGWPDAANNCASALNTLVTTGRLSPSILSAGRSLADPRLRWVTSCAGAVGQFQLQLTSFGDDPICSASPGDLIAACPEAGLALLVAAVTGGEARFENAFRGDPAGDGPSAAFATPADNLPRLGYLANRYVHWDVARGAAGAALQRLGEQLVWQNYGTGRSAGVAFPISARDGLRLGNFTGMTPPQLAARIMGPNPGITTPADLSDDLPPLSGNPLDTLNGLSFAMVYRVTDVNLFARTTPLYTFSPGPCPGGVQPAWIPSVGTLQVAFRGFEPASLNSLTVLLDTTFGDDRETLIPIAWQIYEAGSATEYDPEIRIEVITVLPSITALPIGGSITVSCSAAVVQGQIDSGSSADLSLSGGSVLRVCTDDVTGAAAPQTQTVPLLPRADLSVYRSGGNDFPAIRFSAAAFCPTPSDL